MRPILAGGVWRKCLDMAREGSNVLWVTLDRDGLPQTTLYFQGALFCQIDLLKQADVELFIKVAGQKNRGIPLDTIIIDGVSTASKGLEGFVRQWVAHGDTEPKERAYFTASTKVDQLRGHQNDVVEYMVVHSWTLEEYFAAGMDSRKPSRIYEACRDLWHKDIEDTADDEESSKSSDGDDKDSGKGKGEDDEMVDVSGNGGDARKGGIEDSEMKDVSGNGGDDNTEKQEDIAQADDGAMMEPDLDVIRRILEYRYKYCGGSARWMFNYSLKKVEKKLRTYCNSAENCSGILDGNIGPTSRAAANYFIGSAKKKDGDAEYFLTSMRAVEILAETTKGAVFKVLYPFAKDLDNPSFMGWVIEADFFGQVKQAVNTGTPFEPAGLTPGCSTFVPTSVCRFDHTKNRNRLLTYFAQNTRAKTKNKVLAQVKTLAAELIPQDASHSVACKPISWSQGGYDVFFVEKGDNKPTHICLRFVQVTKGAKHSLEGGFVFTVVQFFETAGYVIESIEFAFILTEDNKNSFVLSDVEGVSFMEDYNRFNHSTKWDGKPEKMSDSVSRYELSLSKHES